MIRVPFDESVPDDPSIRIPRTLGEAFGHSVQHHLQDPDRTTDMLRNERNSALFCLVIIAVSLAILAYVK